MARVCGWLLLPLLFAITAACGASSLPGGVYSSQQYHFKITYPNGWQVNESNQPDAAAPLIVIITRSGERNANGVLVSSLTIDVLNLSALGGTQVAERLAKDKSLTPVTLAGLTAYRDRPTVQQGAGANSAVSVTHTDYFIVHGAYEYQLSIDALPGDGATLDTMARSFILL